MSESVVLAWATLKDEATRAIEVELVRNGWPQGEALLKAMQLSEVSWTIGPQNTPVDTNEDRPGSNNGAETKKGSKKKRAVLQS